jgi:hypothetical protein
MKEPPDPDLDNPNPRRKPPEGDPPNKKPSIRAAEAVSSDKTGYL